MIIEKHINDLISFCESFPEVVGETLVFNFVNDKFDRKSISYPYYRKFLRRDKIIKKTNFVTKTIIQEEKKLQKLEKALVEVTNEINERAEENLDHKSDHIIVSKHAYEKIKENESKSLIEKWEQKTVINNLDEEVQALEKQIKYLTDELNKIKFQDKIELTLPIIIEDINISIPIIFETSIDLNIPVIVENIYKKPNDASSQEYKQFKLIEEYIKETKESESEIIKQIKRHKMVEDKMNKLILDLKSILTTLGPELSSKLEEHRLNKGRASFLKKTILCLLEMIKWLNQTILTGEVDRSKGSIITRCKQVIDSVD